MFLADVRFKEVHDFQGQILTITIEEHMKANVNFARVWWSKLFGVKFVKSAFCPEQMVSNRCNAFQNLKNINPEMQL